MAYLHEDKEEFINAVNLASEYFHILPVIVEKDYYVTMILRELSKRQGFVVFKGGTSLVMLVNTHFQQPNTRNVVQIAASCK